MTMSALENHEEASIPRTKGPSSTYENVDYKENVNFVLKIAKTLLIPLGIYPLHGSNTSLSKFLVMMQIIVIFSLMLFLLVPHLIFTYFVAEDLKKLMKIIAAQVFNSLALIKFWTLIVNKKNLRWCLKELEESWRKISCEKDKLIMLKNAKTGRFLTVAYLSLSYGGALPYHIIMPLVAERIVRDDNTTQIPLPYPCEYVFFVPGASPGYEMLFVTQIIISSMILSTNCGIYSLIATYIVHACCLFEIVGEHLDHSLDDADGDDFNKRLSGIINKHTFAMKYAVTIENSLNIVFLSEMVGCTVIICFLEYGILLDFAERNYLGMVTYIVLMTSIFVNVFILSFIGDRLRAQSAKICQQTYYLDWYKLPKNVAYDLMFIMMRSNRPVTLTAGKLFDVSLQGFADVIKTSAAYLNFLREVI